MRVLLFSGTTEGKELAIRLANAGVETCVSTTNAGASFDPDPPRDRLSSVSASADQRSAITTSKRPEERREDASSPPRASETDAPSAARSSRQRVRNSLFSSAISILVSLSIFIYHAFRDLILEIFTITR